MPHSHQPRYELQVLIKESYSETAPSKEELEVLGLVLGRLWGRVSAHCNANAPWKATFKASQNQGVENENRTLRES